ncbi:MAG: hypothetical protein MZV63_71595 [Marinilabiliales bacterium]|nr:hypothetical protein [Marinilabiliales bacterium]
MPTSSDRLLPLLLPAAVYVVRIKPAFDRKLLGRMLSYSWPLLVGGIAGSLNEVLDKILLQEADRGRRRPCNSRTLRRRIQGRAY